MEANTLVSDSLLRLVGADRQKRGAQAPHPTPTAPAAAKVTRARLAMAQVTPTGRSTLIVWLARG